MASTPPQGQSPVSQTEQYQVWNFWANLYELPRIGLLRTRVDSPSRVRGAIVHGMMAAS